MGIFEDVILNARSAVDTVGKKAGKVIDMSKLALAAADIKTEISKKYEILGRIVFEAKTTGKNYDSNIQELVEKIEELKSQLESINEMLENSRSKTKCTSCGAYNVKGAVFCNKCGEKLAVKKEDEEEEITPDDIVDFTEDNFEDDDMGV